MMVGRHPMAEANEESPFRSLSASEFYKQHSMAHSFVSANDMASRSSRSGGRPSRWSTHVGSSSSPTNDRGHYMVGLSLVERGKNMLMESRNRKRLRSSSGLISQREYI